MASGIDRAREELHQLITKSPVEGDDDDNVSSERIRRVQNVLQEYPELCRERGERDRLPLHEAIENGASFEVLQQLVTSFPESLAISDEYGNTPLHRACVYFDNYSFGLQVYKLLLSPEAVRSRNYNRCLPLHIYVDAERELNLEVVTLLVDAYPESVKAVQNDLRMPLHVVLRSQAAQVNLPVITYLAKKCPQAVRQSRMDCQTPLHVACFQAGKDDAMLAIIKALVDACPEATCVASRSGLTPIHDLALKGRQTRFDVLPIIQLMVEAHHECVTKLNIYQQTPLHNACIAIPKHLPVIRFLAEQYPDALRLRDSENKTPLHAVCPQFVELGPPDPPDQDSCEDVIRYLIQACPEVLEPQGGRGMSTPLHDVCMRRWCRYDFEFKLQLLKILAISEEAVTARDKHGQTPLHVLARHGHVTRESLGALLDKSRELPRMQDDQGRTPLRSAIEGYSSDRAVECLETVECLLQVFPEGVHIPDANGITPLEYACQNDLDLSLIFQLVVVNPIVALRLYHE